MGVTELHAGQGITDDSSDVPALDDLLAMLDADSEQEEDITDDFSDVPALDAVLAMLDADSEQEEVGEGVQQVSVEYADIEVLSSENMLEIDNRRLVDLQDSSQTNATVGGEVSPASDPSEILPFEELMKRLSVEGDAE